MFGNITIDVVTRYATRSLILNMERVQLLWKWDENFIKLYDAVSKKTQFKNKDNEYSFFDYFQI